MGEDEPSTGQYEARDDVDSRKRPRIAPRAPSMPPPAPPPWWQLGYAQETMQRRTPRRQEPPRDIEPPLDGEIDTLAVVIMDVPEARMREKFSRYPGYVEGKYLRKTGIFF